MSKKKFKVVTGVLLVLLIISFMVTLCWGTYKVSPGEVINALLGNGTKLQNTAILTIRLPRLLVGMFVAIALSTAGAILQTITKNDLADTGMLELLWQQYYLLHIQLEHIIASLGNYLYLYYLPWL